MSFLGIGEEKSRKPILVVRLFFVVEAGTAMGKAQRHWSMSGGGKFPTLPASGCEQLPAAVFVVFLGVMDSLVSGLLSGLLSS